MLIELTIIEKWLDECFVLAGTDVYTHEWNSAFGSHSINSSPDVDGALGTALENRHRG